MRRIINELDHTVKGYMRAFIEPYVNMTIKENDQASLRLISDFIDDSQFFWNKSLFMDDEEAGCNKRARITNKHTLPLEGIIHRLLYGYFYIKERFNAELQINTIKEIKTTYPHHIFHPYLNLLEFIEKKCESELSATAILFDKEQEQARLRISKALINYYQEKREHYLKEARKFNRIHDTHIKKTHQLFKQFHELDYASQTMYKNISFFRFKLVIPETLPLAIKLTLFQQIQRTYTKYFNDNNIQAIRKIHYWHGHYVITFICFSVFKQGYAIDQARIKVLSNKLQESFKPLDKQISFSLEVFKTSATLAALAGMRSLNPLIIQRDIYTICRLIIYADFYIKMAPMGIDTFYIINANGFKRLANYREKSYE